MGWMLPVCGLQLERSCLRWEPRRSSAPSGLFGPASTPRYSSIDGLRGYLALAVFLSHSSIWYFYLRSGTWDVPPSNFYTQLGQSSVTLFFMITGFLFWSKLLDGRVQPIDWPRLYLSRVFRLAPLYSLAVVCVVTVSLYTRRLSAEGIDDRFCREFVKWLAFTIPGIAPVNGFAETIPLPGPCGLCRMNGCSMHSSYRLIVSSCGAAGFLVVLQCRGSVAHLRW